MRAAPRGWMAHATAMAVHDEARAAAMAACDAAVRAMHDTREQLRGQVATTVHALAVAIARHLLEREVASDPSVMQKLVSRALTLAPMSGAVSVRMHPEDLAALHGAGGVVTPVTGAIELHWIPDETISRGSCVVESAAAIVDGRIDRALLDIYEQISHD